MNPILSSQNHPENIKLLKASAAAYSKAKGGELKITYLLLFLAVAYPICYLNKLDVNIKYILFGFSFLITLLGQLFADRFKGNTSKGAIFKEEFDTKIFELPWKSTLKKPDRSEIIHYAKQYRGREIKDWYSANLSSTISNNISIAILQHTNTSWDIELRKTYSRWLFNIFVFYTIALIIICVIIQTEILNVFLLFFSLLSFYVHILTLMRGHKAAISKREAISNHLDEIIRSKKDISIVELRDIQDEIYYTRQESAKVPDFFFRWYKKQMDLEAEEYIAEVNDLYR
jgi:ABC-type multidrug transport system fused ATPase/permease subunit